MRITKVQTNNAPEAIGPYSQAIIYNGIVFCSGQIGIDPGTGELINNDVLAQARQVLSNLSAILESAGSSLELALKVEVFLTDLSCFAEVNKIYAEYFIQDLKPARQTVEVSRLPKNAKIEISITAAINQVNNKK